MKIEAIIKSKGGQWFAVIDEPIQLLYTKMDHETIIGTDKDCIFWQFYGFEYVRIKYKQAFGGRHFEIPLTDGTKEVCKGCWWDKMTKSAYELTSNIEFGQVGIATKSQLKNCYVFSGYTVDRVKFNKIANQYNGQIYEYFEYEKILKQ